jgi:hypothetical protein
METVMQHDFGMTPSVDAPRSLFNLSHGHKTTIDVDYIYPLAVLDVLPGDSFNFRASILARMNTPQFPIMDNVYLLEEAIWVPTRLVWENFRKFCGEQDNPADSIDYAIPQFSSFTPTAGTLHDYLDLPINGVAMTPNSIYHRAYNLCYNSWYRDQNLIDSVVVDTDDGPDTDTDYVLQKRGKRFDYFTQALPNPQKFDAVNLPLGTTAPVLGIGKDTATFGTTPSPTLQETGGSGTVIYSSAAQIGQSNSNQHFYVEEDANNTGYPGIFADLTNATASTINDLREAFSVQKLLEMDQRGGTRYPEILANHFSVQFYEPSVRPEILMVNKTPLNVTPVAQTANNSLSGTSTTGSGDLSAYATFGSTDGSFTKSFHEHGMIFYMVSVVADLTYSEGLPIRYTKQTRYDYYWPALMGLGERPILNQELFYSGTPATDEAAFGYIPHWDEYRFEKSKITGTMRPSHASSLDAWHLSQEFGSTPTLNQTFIECDTPLDRVLYSATEPDFTVDCFFDIKAARTLPTYGIPGLGIRL